MRSRLRVHRRVLLRELRQLHAKLTFHATSHHRHDDHDRWPENGAQAFSGNPASFGGQMVVFSNNDSIAHG